MSNTTTNTILVIGSTGKTGNRIAAQLESRETAATGVWSPPSSLWL